MPVGFQPRQPRRHLLSSARVSGKGFVLAESCLTRYELIEARIESTVGCKEVIYVGMHIKPRGSRLHMSHTAGDRPGPGRDTVRDALSADDPIGRLALADRWYTCCSTLIRNRRNLPGAAERHLVSRRSTTAPRCVFSSIEIPECHRFARRKNGL